MTSTNFSINKKTIKIVSTINEVIHNDTLELTTSSFLRLLKRNIFVSVKEKKITYKTNK